MSKWVKIVLAQEISLDDYGDYYSREIIRGSITDWEEISDEDFKFLRNNMYHLFSSAADAGLKPHLLVKDEVPIMQRIHSVRDEIRKYEEKKRQQQEKLEQEKADRARKRMLKKAQSELELLQQLQEKYGVEATIDAVKVTEGLMKKSGKAKTVK